MKEDFHVENVLETQGVFVSTTVGVSMYPMLRDRRDTIVIRPCQGRLNKYDVPLYKRGSSYVLHRIIKVQPDSYTICGDNCIQKEYGITDEQIIGVLTEFYRDNKRISMDGWMYRAYVRIWCSLYPCRRGYYWIRSKAGRIFNFIKKKQGKHTDR